VIGAPVFEAWNQAATDFGDTVRRFAPQLRAAGRWLLGAAAGTGVGLAEFVVSLLIAGFLLASSAGIVSVLEGLTRRLAGDDGGRYLQLVVQTVRSVAAGILGVAILQSMLLGVGFAFVGLPHAGLWTVLCLALAILQLPTGLVAFPAVLYVFSVESTFVAVVFGLWTLVAGLADNVLKPLLLGRGGSVPMLVIFMGAIGGFLALGFLGLFIGAIVLSLGYEILLAWVQGETVQGEEVD
jgi:predicted PurR-regulated permease PerM